MCLTGGIYPTGWGRNRTVAGKLLIPARESAIASTAELPQAAIIQTTAASPDIPHFPGNFYRISPMMSAITTAIKFFRSEEFSPQKREDLSPHYEPDRGYFTGL